MAEGLLTHSTGSRKKTKQKTFDVFHQSPISGSNISRAVPCVGPIDFAPPGCRKNRVSDGQNGTSDSDSSTKSGTGSSPFTPSSPTVCVNSQGVSQSTPIVPYSNNDHGAKHRKENSPGANTFVTASVRQPIVSIDRNPPALGKHTQSVLNTQNPGGTLNHLSNNANFSFPTDPATLYDNSAAAIQLRKLSDHSVVSVPQVMAGKSFEMGTTRSAFSPVMGGTNIVPQDGTTSVSRKSTVAGPPRLPPRVPLQQKPFGKQHKRNSANCSVSGSNASINSCPANAPAAHASSASSSQSQLPGQQPSESASRAMVGKNLGGAFTASATELGIPSNSKLKDGSEPMVTSPQTLALAASVSCVGIMAQSSNVPQRDTTGDVKESSANTSGFSEERTSKVASGTTKLKGPSPLSFEQSLDDIVDKICNAESQDKRGSSSPVVKLTSPLQVSSASITSANLSKTATEKSGSIISNPQQLPPPPTNISNFNNQPPMPSNQTHLNNASVASSPFYTPGMQKTSDTISVSATALDNHGASANATKPSALGTTGSQVHTPVAASQTPTVGASFAAQRTGAHRSGQIWELLEGGQLSHGTSTLFRSLPILRSGPSPQNLRNKLTTQSLNRSHFQTGNGTEEYNIGVKGKSSAVEDQNNCDSYHLNSRVLQDKIIALDRQRAHLLAKIERESQRLKYYSEKFFNLKVKLNGASEEELQCLQSDEIVLVCKLEEEFGFKSEQQLKESVDFQTEQLSKMDEKLIQLFEVLYILETAESNFEDELHLVASEGAILTKSRVLSTDVRVIGTSGLSAVEENQLETSDSHASFENPPICPLPSDKTRESACSAKVYPPNTTTKVFIEPCNQSPVNVERSIVAGSQTSGYSSHVSGVPKNLGNASMKPNFSSPVNNGGSPDFSVMENVHVPKHKPAASSYQPVGMTPQIEMMYQFLAFFNNKNYEEMSKTFLLMSSTPESCSTMRQSGCLPLIIQLIHCELDSALTSSANDSGVGSSGGGSKEVAADSSVDSIDSITSNLESTSLSIASGNTSSGMGTESWTPSSNPGASVGTGGAATNSTPTTTGATVSGGGTIEEDLDMFHITVALKSMSDLNKNCDNVRQRSIESLHNIIHSQPDSPQTNREIKVLSYLAHIRSYSENICEQYNELLALERDYLVQKQKRGATELEKHILVNASAQMKLLEPVVSLIYTLVKLSFNPEELTSFQTLGGIAAVCELMLVDIGREFISMKYSPKHDQQSSSMNSSGNSSVAALSHLSTKLRRHIAELLTNVTHKNQAAKSTLTHYPKVMRVFSAQLRSDHEDLVHVTSDLFRNLAWQPERSQKMLLREMNVVLLLSEALVKFNNMMTLRAILSALWNLSNHCTENKVEICSVGGCLEKVISLMKQDISASYNANSATNVTCQIAVNASGLLSHLCSHIATRGELRQMLRNWNTCNTLLEFAKCPNLTLVANACSCLFYLSARDRTDQEVLWQLGAPSILKDLAKECSASNPKVASAAHGAFKNLMQAKKQLKMNPSGNSSLSFCPGTGSDDNAPPSPIMNGGVAQLVRPAVMIDYNGSMTVDGVDLNDQKRFMDDPVVDPGSEFRRYANLSGPGAAGGANLGFDQGVDLSFSGAKASKDMSWNEESYSDNRNNRVSSASPQQQSKPSPSLIPKQNRFNSKVNQGKVLHASRQAALMHRDDELEFNGNRKFVSPARRGSPSTGLMTSSKGQAVDPKPSHNLQMVSSNRGAAFDNYNDDLRSSQMNSAAADEVVNYTLKYANSEPQYDNFDGPVHGAMSSYTDCYRQGGAQGENEEPEYYEQPTDFSARFQENDAMSTYEELNYNSYSKNGAVDVTLVNDVSLSTIGNQSSGFGDSMYHDINEHNDGLSDTVPSQSGGASNSPAGVFRQVRFNSSVKETVNDIQTGRGLSSTALLESERQVASGSHKNNFQSSVRRSHMSSVSSSANSHFEPEESGKKESASGTPLMGETPLMFSRRSSVSSLSDFETQSINSNSNFTSEQGSRAISGAVSPSDIPDSPNEAMLAERMGHDTENIQDPTYSNQISNMQQNNMNREMRNMDMAEYDMEAESDDKPRVFATETTPHEYSCASSLSALSFDDQPKVKKGNKQNQAFVGTHMNTGTQGQIQLPPRLNLTATNAIVQELSGGKNGNNIHLQKMNDQETEDAAEDSESAYGADETVDFANVTGINESDDDSLLNDDDNLQGNLYNEEDHSVLMEAISSGMPEKKVKSSSSKRQHNASSESINSNAIKGSSPKAGPSVGSYSASYKDRRSPGLTRSNSGRNLSNSGRKSPGPSKANAGGNFPGGAASNNPRPQHSYLGIYLRRSSQTESTISSPRGTGVHMDSVKTYHTEGTPLNFSTATSLSDLSVAAEETGHHANQMPSYQQQAQQQTYANMNSNQTQQTYANINGNKTAMNPKDKTRLKSWNIHSPGGGSVSKYSNNTGFDSPRVYNVEGTPASFSRNDSLSSLSCDEGIEDNPSCNFMEKNTMPFIPEGSNMTGGIAAGTNEGVFVQVSSNVTAAKSRIPAPIAPVSGSKIPLSKSGYRPSSRGAESRSGNSSPSIEHRKSQNISNDSSKSNVNDDNGNASSPSLLRNVSSNSQGHHENQGAENFAEKNVNEDNARSSMRQRSLSEISNGSSGSGDDVGMEDKALLDECIYSAMPSSARKQQKHRPVNKKHNEVSTEGSTELSTDVSAKRKINYSITNENDNSSTVLND